MRSREERKHLCLLCRINEVTESRTVETTDAIPDQCNCDLNQYRDYMVEGGKLLKLRAHPMWLPAASAKATTFGALCNDCLASPVTKPLIPHIAFE